MRTHYVVTRVGQLVYDMQDAVVGTRRPCNQRHRGQAADKTEKHDTYGAIRHGDVTVETQGPGVSCKVGVPRIWAGSCKDTKVLLLDEATGMFSSDPMYEIVY